MIKIKKSKTADSRACDFANVTKETLYASSQQHVGDIAQAFEFFRELLAKQSSMHDHDKFSDIDGFHRDFIGGFKNTTWWDNHRKVNRHHLTHEEGIREDVNLVDVLDYIIDCVMAGMGRSGSVYDITLPSDLLQKAFANTVSMLKNEVIVED